MMKQTKQPTGKWPETIERKCVTCPEIVHLTRKGDGKLFRGRPNYWYTSDHNCQSEEAQRLRESNRRLNELFMNRG